MNSLSEFLSSPLLYFISSNSPSNNTEQPDKLDMLLEILSELMFSYSIEELLTTLAMINTSKTRALLLPTLTISYAIAHALEYH